MDSLLDEFEDLKISALSKSKLINKYVHNVTIGPNSSFIEQPNNKISSKQVADKTKKTVLTPQKSPNSNVKRTSIGKILTEIEALDKEDIASCVRSRLEIIQDASKKLNDRMKLDWLKRQQMLVIQAQQQEELMMKVLEEHDKKAVDYLHQLQIQHQKQAEERNKRNLEIQMKEKHRHHLLVVFEAIQKQQQNFRLLYQDIVSVLKECNIPNIITNPAYFSVISKVSSSLKTLLLNMEKIKENCKTQTSELPEKLKNSEQMVQTIESAKQNLEFVFSAVKEAANLKQTLQTLLKNYRENEIKQIATSQEISQSKHEQKIVETVSTTTDATDSSHQITLKETFPKQNEISKPEFQPPIAISEFANKNAIKEYSNLQQYLENYRRSFADLVNDPRFKQFRFHCQKAVNIPLNAISAVSSQHMLDKFNRLSNLLRGQNVEVGGTTVSSAQHPQGIAFCTDLLAKKFVLQGDLLISSNPESAHCYAAVLIALWHDFPDFGKLVLAYFYQYVPYLVPFYPPKISGQTDQEYYISLGYNYIDGVVEKHDKYLKRMSGIMRLYAALTISKLKKGQHGPHPHGLSFAWKWIANVLNMEPRSDITASLLLDFLEVTGSSMQIAYGNQFKKILMYIDNVYVEKMRKIDSGGPVTRLEVILHKVKKHGQIEPPKGRLYEGFW